MKFLLLLMFFVSPPVKVPPAQRAYTLQSTTVMEFQSDTMANAEQLCKFFGKEIQLNAAKTDTVTVLGWCLPASGTVVTVAKDVQRWQELPRQFALPPGAKPPDSSTDPALIEKPELLKKGFDNFSLGAPTNRR